ncbi:4Fe-4S dicluster domain-containing protein [Desulfuromusa kysingii]|nr:4Fe-4S dicluster domain-containing protein [Desulfuromusa kysingii]
MTTDKYPYPNSNTYTIPVLCQHCNEPECVPACPHGVFTKREDGIVTVGDTTVCMSCDDKPCLKACPFGVIDLDPTDGRIGKCDMCVDLVDKGETPACAFGCWTGSILFGDFDDPDSVVSQTVAAWEETGYVHQLKAGNGKGGSVYYLLSRKQWENMDNLYSPAWHNA